GSPAPSLRTLPLAVDRIKPEASPALAQPQTELVSLALPQPGVVPLPMAVKQSETFLVGLAGEERPDYTFRYNSDGSVRETVVYYYGDDLRAASAHAGHPLRREAVYRGRVDAYRLHAACKRSDTHYIGAAGHERRDTQV